MNLKIVEKKKNPLLKRKELVVKIANQGSTPRESDLVDKLSAVLDAKPELFEVKTIKQKFGIKESVAFINLYDSAEAFKKIAPKRKEKESKKEEKDENVPDESGQIKVDLDESSEEEKSEEKPEKKEEKSEKKSEKSEVEKKEEKKEKTAEKKKEKEEKSE